MNTKVSNIFYGFRVFLVVLTCLFGVAIFFINSNFLCNLLVRSLHLKIAPSFIGGEVAEVIYDDSEDDFGSGILTYPMNSEFAEGSMDLLQYTVHKPVFNAAWQTNPDYWQLDLDFRSGSEDVRNIMIYLGIDTEQNQKLEALPSSAVPLNASAENVVFDSVFPWNYAVWIGGKEGKVFDCENNFICDAEMIFLNKGKTIKVRIPLKDKGLQRVYSAPKTYHYVLVGAYSRFDVGGFMPIEKRRSNSRGGTAKSNQFNTLIPKVYDILGDNQQLATWNKDELTRATVHPVCADMEREQVRKDDEKDFIDGVYTALSQKSGEENSESGSYFGYETLDEALAAFEKEIAENPESPVSNSHYGSCLAMKGGQSSVVQAVIYVNNAFEYLDKGVELSKTDEEKVEALMNRASVCKSVPENVFGKSLTGAMDFVEVAKIQKKNIAETSEENLDYEKNVLAYIYISASECFKSAGQETEAQIMLQEAKKAVK